MDAAVAVVTAEYAALNGNSRGNGRRRGGAPRSGYPGPSDPSYPSNGQDGLNGEARGRGGRGRGNRNRNPRPNGRNPSTASENGGNVRDLPAPATQVTSSQNHRHIQARGPARYRSQLSSATSDPIIPTSGGNEASSSRLPVPSAEELAQLSYRERLTLQLNSSSIDCPICINNIARKQSIASCRTCSAPYHLKCLKDWAERSIATVKEKAALQPQQPGIQIRANWRCPSCQTQYAETDSPRNYWCFCGRLRDPRASGLGNAHSCEKPCKRDRPEGCTHSCPLVCHPANCDPCNVMLRMHCHCGKEDKTIKCGTLHPQSGTSQKINVNEFLSCGKACGKMLSCGLHTCDKECHAGECGGCETIREKTCYCSQEVKQEACGGAEQSLARQTCFGLQEEASWTGEFSCGQPCPWIYDCGIHQEATTDAKTCHPHASSIPLTCPRSPSIVTTCACGQTPLSDLQQAPRTVCTDPISSCGKICSRPRVSCEHQCRDVCHEGDCGRCEETVKLVCRCGNEKRTLKCWQLQEQGEDELRCERVCRALRACGRHECGRKCCPLAYQEANKKQRRRPLSTEDEDPMGFHICDRVCGRKLNCGQHTCEQPDHKGPCPPCLRSSFEEISCHCGSTVLIPPVPCSTRITCNQPCDRPNPPCGHQKAPHACHEDDVACPPCPFLTEKLCSCGSSTVKNVRCSQANVTCGKPCGALLGCGYHRCRKMCHPAGECEDCTQVCGKPRAHCGHPCQAKCHAPSKCNITEPCPELVEATCPCGHVKQRTRCGSRNSRPETSGGVKLACSPTCATAQRNAALAEALGISKDRAAGAAQETTWLPETLSFYGENAAWCKGIEQIFLDTIDSSRATHLFPAMKYPQRKLVHEIAEKFKLRSESLDEEPFRSVLIAKKADSAVPKPSLSEAWLAQYKLTHTTAALAPKKALVTRAVAPPAAQPKQEINCLYLESCFGYDEQSLKEALGPYMQGMQFQLRWLTDEDVICLPKTSLTASELTLKLRLVRNSLRNKIAMCKTIDTAFFDASLDSVTHKDKQWTDVPPLASASASGSTTPTAWQSNTARPSFTNAFSGLAVAGKSKAKSRPVSPASSTHSTGSARGLDIISNGYHRAPSAVVVHGEQTEAPAENWEDYA